MTNKAETEFLDSSFILLYISSLKYHHVCLCRDIQRNIFEHVCIYVRIRIIHEILKKSTL